METAELLIDKITIDDRSLVVLGGVFYWGIGHEISPTGQIRRVSEIHMRRAPVWSERSIHEIKKRAEKLFDQLK